MHPWQYFEETHFVARIKRRCWLHGRRSWGDEGVHPPTTEAGGGMACTIIPPYKGDEQMKSILHNTQIITLEEIVSYIDDEIIFSRKFE